MSLDVIVRRAIIGPYKHQDVTQPLLGNSIEAAIELGSTILDENGTGAQSVEYTVTYRPGLHCGLIVQLFDTLLNQTIYGKIISVEHSAQRSGDHASIVLTTKLKLLRPTQFFSKSSADSGVI